ncbi:MAG: D-hexose-6-phosphate mutarotase [Phycisphaerales bacterium]|jgi:glucose-6-phosphate 1-epimerase|nr:D-hexose-6-phosphate mutarotase [Phycisphaerales bacterium]
MTELEKLQTRFGITGLARVEEGMGGLARLSVSTPAADATIYLHGAHVAHYKPAGQRGLLFMSAASQYRTGRPIRGGIPICFPWFAAKVGNPEAPMHGFVRLGDWSVESIQRSADGAAIVLGNKSNSATKMSFNADFELRYHILIGEKLDLTLEVRNTGEREFTFEEALHTYLAVADARKITIEGLENTEYVSKTENLQRKTQSERLITIDREVDRVYQNTQTPCVLEDPGFGRTITVEKEGSHTTVVWNPWIDKARNMPDFGDEEWTGMVCIETANTAENAVKLEAGQTHRLRAMIKSVPH